MSRQHHELKTETKHYQAVERGEKFFEVRRNDRDFKKFDMVTLKETVSGVYTGRKLEAMEIKYILYGGQFGIKKRYCVFGFKKPVVTPMV